MARYINSYSTAADVQSAIDGGTLNKPYVAYIENEDVIDWNSSVPAKEMPLTFEIISGGTVLWKTVSDRAPSKTIEYSLNDGEWTSITSSTGGTEIQVLSGDVIRFRGDNASYAWGGDGKTARFNSTDAKFKIKGNLLSLLNSSGYTTMTAFTADYAFIGLFEGCTGLIDASKLYLPTFIRKYCYHSMFQYCTGLTTAPELPATTLAEKCYIYMFRGCSSLNYIKCLATDISADKCTYIWAQSVASTGTFVTPASTNWTTGTSGIPSGWTRVNV